MSDNGDMIGHIERELADARASAASAFDRVDALGQLRALALQAAADTNRRLLTIEELWAYPTTPEGRAELDALSRRAFGLPTG